MARFRKRPLQAGFRVSDLLRLMSMVGMLCVLGMLIFRARDESMWRIFISDSRPSNGPPELDGLPPEKINAPTQPPKAAPTEPQASSTAKVQQKPEVQQKLGSDLPASSDASSTQVATPKNPEEWARAEIDFQLIEDKKVLEYFDMPAYWRLLNWTQTQSMSELAQQSDKDVTFTDFVQRPDEMRGKLCRLKLHMLRSKRYEAGKNPHGFEWLYEVWGYTNDSNPYPYCIVFSDWPKGMPLGNDLAEEATVDAYFLKLMKYEAHDSKLRMAPVLLGRLVWHPNPLRTPRKSTFDYWNLILIAGAIGMVILGFKVYRIVFPAPALPEIRVSAVDPATTEDWLQGIEHGEIPAFLTDDAKASSDEFDKGVPT